MVCRWWCGEGVARVPLGLAAPKPSVATVEGGGAGRKTVEEMFRRKTGVFFFRLFPVRTRTARCPLF